MESPYFIEARSVVDAVHKDKRLCGTEQSDGVLGAVAVELENVEDVRHAIDRGGLLQEPVLRRVEAVVC